jgi:transmembrane sensor
MRFGARKDRDTQAVALDWALRLDRGELTEAERCELDAWLAGDVRRRGALIRAQALWHNLRLTAAASGATATVAHDVRNPYRVLGRVAAAVVGLAAILGGGSVSYAHLAGREVSDLGEIRRIALEDGSTMLLNTKSIANVRFDDGERRIILRRGEASFVVTRDTRPFVVEAGDVAIAAVATSFAVRMRPNDVSVTVSDGAVEVVREEHGRLERRRLATERQLTVAPARPMQARVLSSGDVSRQLSWRDGVLIFDGEQLLEAVREVNRYSQHEVVIDERIAATKPLVGVFRVGDVRSFAYAVASLFDAQVVEENGRLRVVPG